MAGGSGTRFWPRSKQKNPKQFLNISGKRSLLKSTLDRFHSFVEWDHIFIAARDGHQDAMDAQKLKVPASNILGEKDKGWPALTKPLNRATLILCTYMVGGCQHVLDMTVEYAQTRVQFGRPIGAFQWVQGYIIEQANQLEKARWLTNEALWKLDANKPEREQDEAVSLAKAVASEAFHECGHLGHEVHAGVGIDRKYRLYLYSKKAKTLYSYLGDPYYHRKRVAQILEL